MVGPGVRGVRYFGEPEAPVTDSGLHDVRGLFQGNEKLCTISTALLTKGCSRDGL